MNNQITQSLGFKLERRYSRLRSVGFGAFQSALQDFWRFFDEEPVLTFLETQVENSKDEHIKNYLLCFVKSRQIHLIIFEGKF